MTTIPLDPEQQAAVEAPERRVRVQAGAGSGKTRTLTSRIEWLVQQGVPPTGILAITFTKKAAEELSRRLSPATAGVQASTIHSLGYYLLRAERRYRRIADEGMKRRLVRNALRDQQDVQPDVDLPSYAECLSMIGHAKTHGHPFEAEVLTVAQRYQELLRENNLFDFDDLVIEPLAMFRHHPEIAARWATRWPHVLIDEVQDTSRMQWSLMTHLVAPETSVYVVGDQGQAIYKWRGADPESMANLDETFAGDPFVDYALSTNYRSVGRIVAAANGISVRMARKGLHIREHRPTADGPVVYRLPALRDSHDVGAVIADLLKAEYAKGLAWSEMSVLYRINASSEALEAAFSKAGIPYVIVGGMGFYGRSEVKDVLAYLKLTQGLDQEAIERIYYKPARYLGKVWLKEVMAGGGWQAFLFNQITFSKKHMQRNADSFRETLLSLQRMSDAQPADVVEFVRSVAGIGYQDWVVGEEPDLVDEAVVENLDALQEGAERWRSVPEFLAFAGLCQRTAGSESPSDQHAIVDRVALSTVHRAKGLEWPVVVVYGLSDQVFPHYRNDPEEERRILYVAVTRARDRLYFATAGGAPSRYWNELRETHDVAVPAPEGLPTCGDDPDQRRDDDLHHADERAAGSSPAVE